MPHVSTCMYTTIRTSFVEAARFSERARSSGLGCFNISTTVPVHTCSLFRPYSNLTRTVRPTLNIGRSSVKTQRTGTSSNLPSYRLDLFPLHRTRTMSSLILTFAALPKLTIAHYQPLAHFYTSAPGPALAVKIQSQNLVNHTQLPGWTRRSANCRCFALDRSYALRSYDTCIYIHVL